MSALSIQPTYPIFTETDGQPLEDGYIWIGTANLDPQTNPINVYWDAALTQLAGQPIRTEGGYPVNSGTPARLYVNSDYSIRVMNKNGSVVYSAPAATERYNAVVVSSINAEDVLYDPPFANAVQTNQEEVNSRYVSVKDFGAVGNGSTDDYVKIVAAIAAADAASPKLSVYFPSGAYAVSDSIVLPEGVRIYGAGSSNSIIKAVNWAGTAGDPVLINDQAAYDPNHIVENIGFNGNGTNAGVYFRYGYHNSFFQCDWTNCVGYSVKLTEAGDALFHFCKITVPESQVGVIVDGGSGTHLFHCDIYNDGYTSIGITSTQIGFLGGPSGCWVDRCLFSGLGGVGVDVLKAQDHWIIDNCYFEGAQGASYESIRIGFSGTRLPLTQPGDVTVSNCIIATGNNSDLIVYDARTLVWENNRIGVDVTFGHIPSQPTFDIRMLFHTGNTYNGSAEPIFNCSRYFRMEGRDGGTNEGKFIQAGAPAMFNTSVPYGVVTMNTAYSAAGPRAVIGNINDPTLTTGLYLRGTTAAVDIVTGGASLQLGSVGGVWVEAKNDRFIPGADNTFYLGDNSHKWISVWAVNGTIQTSDARQKTDVVACDLGLDFLSTLKPVSYRWINAENVPVGKKQIGEEDQEVVNEDGSKSIIKVPVYTTIYEPRAGVRRHYGLIAQDVEEALNGKDFAGFIHDKQTGEKGLRYDQFIPVLVKAVQELSNKVSEQQKEIAALQSKLGA
jgi:hypothetical protein